MEVLYLCTRMACADKCGGYCDSPDCRHTTDIRYAKYFVEKERGIWEEKEDCDVFRIMCKAHKKPTVNEVHDVDFEYHLAPRSQSRFNELLHEMYESVIE